MLQLERMKENEAKNCKQISNDQVSIPADTLSVVSEGWRTTPSTPTELCTTTPFDKILVFAWEKDENENKQTITNIKKNSDFFI